MRSFWGAAVTAVFLVFALPIPGHGAIVGTFTAAGEQLTVPLAFEKTTFNSVIDVDGGLSFAIAPGLSAPVKLEVLEGTKNVRVAAAAIGTAFGIVEAANLPLSITSDTLSSGVHSFALGVVASGSQGSAIIARLTLTPLPGALLLLGPAVMALGAWNFARKRPEAPEVAC